MATQEEIDSMNGENTNFPPKDARVSGPTSGGQLAVDRFGILVATGDQASIARFYNGELNEPKRLIESLGGKIWVRDERFG